MNTFDCLVAFIVFSILVLLGYIVKRSFDENALYIQQGYHQVPSTSLAWIK
jgi:hypothetical protein